jgi:hypothetical protein
MRVLVCGGRDYKDKNRVFEILDEIHRQFKISFIIEGGAAGADDLAMLWSVSREVPKITYHADWENTANLLGLYEIKKC